jgi:hypothetical protein
MLHAAARMVFAAAAAASPALTASQLEDLVQIPK